MKYNAAQIRAVHRYLEDHGCKHVPCMVCPFRGEPISWHCSCILIEGGKKIDDAAQDRLAASAEPWIQLVQQTPEQFTLENYAEQAL